MAAPQTIPGINAIVEVLISGRWLEVPGTADASASGGDAPEADVPAYEGVAKATGHPRLPSISVNVPQYNPLHETFTELRKQAGASLSFRLVTKGAVTIPGGDAATHGTMQYTKAAGGETSGVLEFTKPTGEADAVAFLGFAGTGADPRVARGSVVNIGGKRFSISQVGAKATSRLAAIDDVALKALGYPLQSPDADVAAASFKIEVPGLRKGPFVGTVRSGDNFELPAESILNHTLQITPRSNLGDWAVAGP